MRIRLRKPLFSRLGFVHHQPVTDVDPFLLQTVQTATRDLRVRILHRRNHAGHPAAISASQHGGVRP
ncbi:Uncharacterised protein [Klebsiella michiganensis]|uniref:Uncharacterized protein n=1 Tax=Klebsiella michiganensis TaxID=1134687 RepID=A0A7H4N685_9ENTR|nr:Uncharacterised protein [Klebsiella michiganensis]